MRKANIIYSCQFCLYQDSKHCLVCKVKEEAQAMINKKIIPIDLLKKNIEVIK